MEQKEIYDLISRFEESALSVMDIKQDSFKIHLEKNNGIAAGPMQASVPVAAVGTAIAPQAEIYPVESGYEKVRSPIVGVFYQSASPEEPAFVKEGDRVRKGQALCLVEAMKMMNELKSPVDGIIRSIKGTNGELVEFDQILFEVEPC